MQDQAYHFPHLLDLQACCNVQCPLERKKKTECK